MGRTPFCYAETFTLEGETSQGSRLPVKIVRPAYSDEVFVGPELTHVSQIVPPYLV